MSFPTLVDELCNVSWQGSLRWLTRFVTLLPSSLSTRLLQLFFHVKSAEGFGEGLSSCVQPLLQLTLPANLVRFKLSHYEGITYRILMNDADILVLVCAVTVMRYVALLSFSVFQEVDEDSDWLIDWFLRWEGGCFFPPGNSHKRDKIKNQGEVKFYLPFPYIRDVL